MLACKYCKKPGKFDPVTRKVLCSEHMENQRQLKAIWEAITQLEIKTEEHSSSESCAREDRTLSEENQLSLIRFLENDRE